MPRNVSTGIYTTPVGTTAIPDTTIESTKYNANTADVEQDLNLPRPIVAGGTGANSAHDARINLAAEVSAAEVTNYNSQVWESGSFWSQTTSTGGPVAGTVTTGFSVVLQGSQDWITLIATDHASGNVYSRIRTAGVWGAWKQRAGSLSDIEAAFVNVAGDTMTGSLTLSGSAGLAAGGSVVTGNAGTAGSYFFGNTGTKYLSYDGISFNLTGGAFALASGSITIAAGGLVANGVVISQQSSTVGTYYFGSSGTKYLQYDGTNFNLVGGTQFTINADSTNHRPASTNATNIIGSCNVSYRGSGSQHGLILRTTAESGVYAIAFENVSSGVAGSITHTATVTSFNTSSDMRLKEDMKAFDAGNIVDQTNVYDFAWKDTSERSFGILAQQAAEVYPQAVTYVEMEDWWGIDYSKYVPVILQELKALRARVAELEGQIVAKPA